MNTFPIKNKGDYIESLSEENLNKGLVKLYIPDPDSVVSGESIWGYLEPNKYSATDEDVKIILLNDSFCYLGLLHWGDEILCKRKRDSYILDVDWINNCILNYRSDEVLK